MFDKFREAITAAGIDPPSEITDDGAIHRYAGSSDKTGSKKNWYILFPTDGSFQAGSFGRWVGDSNGAVKWCSKEQREFSEEEKKAYARRMSELKKAQEKQRADSSAECAAKCLDLWAKASPASPDHPYLARKGVEPFKIKQIADTLYVPLIEVVDAKTMNLRGIQFIKPDGSKMFKTGCDPVGAIHWIGPQQPVDNTVIVCEGYATGASIHMATGYTVFIAFVAGNLDAAAKLVRKLGHNLIVAADDDKWAREYNDKGEVIAYHAVPCSLNGVKRVNTGMNKGIKAAQDNGGQLRRPLFSSLESHPTDFNDLHLLDGLDAVKKSLFPPPPDKKAVEGREHLGQFANAPFEILGHDDNVFYYLPHATREIMALSAPEHSTLNMIVLAPVEFWGLMHPKRKGFDNQMCFQEMKSIHSKRGKFNPATIRGVGTWLEDDGRIILHKGDHLVIEGKKHPVGPLKDGKFIYELGYPADLGITSNQNMLPQEAVKLFKLCNALSWENPISATLLAGWCVLAPVCGSLKWRPHIHVTGGSGTGKSWVMENIVRPIVGPIAVHVQGSTTEAGIRQTLRRDARPVLFDEAEGENRKGQERMQGVLELARQASTSSGASVSKGSTNGKAISHAVNSMFCFASIGVSAKQRADQSRVSLLTLRSSKDNGKRFNEVILPLWREIITDEYCVGIRSRIVRLLPIIRDNGPIFSRVVSRHLGGMRTGDQIGYLLAGAYALQSDTLVTEQIAEEFVKRQNWTEHTLTEETLDEMQCLSTILDGIIRDSSGKERSVAELCEAVMGNLLEPDSSTENYRTLRRNGIICAKNGIYIADSSTEIKRRLADTPWPENWGKQLMRLEGAVKHPTTMRFSSPARATFIPSKYVIETGGEHEPPHD